MERNIKLLHTLKGQSLPAGIEPATCQGERLDTAPDLLPPSAPVAGIFPVHPGSPSAQLTAMHSLPAPSLPVRCPASSRGGRAVPRSARCARTHRAVVVGLPRGAAKVNHHHLVRSGQPLAQPADGAKKGSVLQCGSMRQHVAPTLLLAAGSCLRGGGGSNDSRGLAPTAAASAPLLARDRNGIAAKRGAAQAGSTPGTTNQPA